MGAPRTGGEPTGGGVKDQGSTACDAPAGWGAVGGVHITTALVGPTKPPAVVGRSVGVTRGRTLATARRCRPQSPKMTIQDVQSMF